MDRPVTIHEMENIIGAVDAADFAMAGDIGGNIIEISDSNDALGLGMLANPGRQRGGSGGGGGGGGGDAPSSSGGGAFGGGGLAEVEIGGLDTVEPITLNLGGGGGMGSSGGSPPPMEFEIKRSGGGAFDSTPFSNTQTATGPSYGLSAAQSPMRLSQEEERAKKIDYLNKLQRLEQKDFQMSKRFTMDNTLDEMKQEYDRLVDARNLAASLRFQRQALMSVVTGLEWVNGRFDPFDLKLDGWSESVHEKLDNEEFDDIFEELYDKYKERGKMPPEARLVMSLAGSGFMIHVSNTFLKSKMSNISAEDILKNNPDLARQFATAAANQAGGGFGNFMNMAMGGAGGAGPAAQAAPVGAGAMYDSSARAAAQAAAEAKARAAAEMAFQQQSRGNGGAPMAQVPQSVAAMEPPRATARREMRGPTGVDDILRQFEEARRDEAMDGSTAFPSAMPTAMQQPATVAAIEIQSMASGDDIGSAAESTRTGRGGGRRRRAPVGNVMSLEL
jgi:hypothetical protein